MVANAIGFELYKNKPGIKSELNSHGIQQIWLEDDDIERVRLAATRVIKELVQSGWSKDTKKCDCDNCNCGSGCSCGVDQSTKEAN